jgi:hypothetical protein
MANRYSSLYSATPSVTTASGAISSSTSYAYKGPGFARQGEMVAVSGTVTLTSNLLIGEQILLFPVPKGFRLHSLNHEWEDLDTGTTLDMDLGLLTQNPDAYINAGAAYQSADSTAAGNSATENGTELAFDEPTVTADADVVGFTVIASGTGLTAPKVITFRAVGYVA